MTSGPICVQVLEGENAIALNRQIMGATNPQEAEPGTLRADFAESVGQNAVHGSDSPESAAREVAFFFEPSEILAQIGRASCRESGDVGGRERVRKTPTVAGESLS